MAVVSYRFLGTIWTALLLASCMAACGAEPASPRGDGEGVDTGGDTTPAVTPGVAGGPCYPNDSCNAGLACTGGICTDPASAAGEAGGPCYPNDTCNAGLVCSGAICAVASVDDTGVDTTDTTDTTDTGLDTGVDTGDTTDTGGSGDATDTTDTGGTIVEGVVRLAIEPSGLILTAAGESAQLRAVGYDAADNIIEVPEAAVSWVATGDAVVVDLGAGRYAATAEIGTSLVFASIAGVASDPVAILTTRLQPDVVRIEEEAWTAVVSWETDRFVLDLPSSVVVAPGQLLLGNGAVPWSGRVLAVRPSERGITVELGSASINELFSAFSFTGSVNVDELEQGVPKSRTPKTGPPSWKCTSLPSPSRLTVDFSPVFSLSQRPRLSWRMSDDEMTVRLTGPLAAEFGGDVTLGLPVGAEWTCSISLLENPIPIPLPLRPLLQAKLIFGVEGKIGARSLTEYKMNYRRVASSYVDLGVSCFADSVGCDVFDTINPPTLNEPVWSVSSSTLLTPNLDASLGIGFTADLRVWLGPSAARLLASSIFSFVEKPEGTKLVSGFVGAGAEMKYSESRRQLDDISDRASVSTFKIGSITPASYSGEPLGFPININFGSIEREVPLWSTATGTLSADATTFEAGDLISFETGIAEPDVAEQVLWAKPDGGVWIPLATSGDGFFQWTPSVADQEAGSIDFGVMLLDGRLPPLGVRSWYTELNDNSLLALTSCLEGFHFEGGVCTSDIRSCLPMPANTTEGTQTWDRVVRDYGVCTATACAATYHVEGGVCTSDIRSCLPMPANTTAATQTWDSVASDYGTCTATACAATYHVEGGVCVSDIRSCSPLPPNATAATQTWDSVASDYGTCTATACATAYHVEGGVCVGCGPSDGIWSRVHYCIPPTVDSSPTLGTVTFCAGPTDICVDGSAGCAQEEWILVSGIHRISPNEIQVDLFSSDLGLEYLNFQVVGGRCQGRLDYHYYPRDYAVIIQHDDNYVVTSVLVAPLFDLAVYPVSSSALNTFGGFVCSLIGIVPTSALVSISNSQKLDATIQYITETALLLDATCY
jgi:hypothetical protein